MDIGQKLREKRESLGKSLSDLHQETRISIEHLQFLEANNFTFLPSTYVRSFLKNYSNTLGLDSDEILESLGGGDKEATSEEQQVSTARATSTGVKTSTILEGSLVFAAVVLIAGIAFAYFQYRAQIAARPQAPSADLSQATRSLGDAKPRAALFELHIDPAHFRSVRLYVDGEERTEDLGAGTESVLRITEGEFEITMKDAQGLHFPAGTEELNRIAQPGKPIRLTFRKESSNGKH